MAYQKYFLRALEHHFPDASGVMKEVEGRYQVIAKETSFARTSSNPMDRRLDFTAYFLALIQVLEVRNWGFDEIKAICLDITHDYVRPKNKWQRWTKRLPVRLLGTGLMSLVIKPLAKKLSAKGHPDGFLAAIKTDKAETYGLGYGIDILECGICKLFAKHNAQQYVPILCEVDKYTSGLAGLELVRSGTIANGAEKCDFRFKKKT